MRRAAGVPVAFETGVNYLRPQPDEIPDGLFVRRVAEAADCGILLDLHNLLTNERNGRVPLRAVFDDIPHERVWEIHLAGGREYHGYWLDSHSGHIDDDLFTAAGAVVGGVLIGVIESMAGFYLPEGWKDVAPYIVLLLVLLLKPEGLFGLRMRKKV